MFHITHENWIKRVLLPTPKAFLMITPRWDAFENLYLSGKIGIEEIFKMMVKSLASGYILMRAHSAEKIPVYYLVGEEFNRDQN